MPARVMEGKVKRLAQGINLVLTLVLGPGYPRSSPGLEHWAHHTCIGGPGQVRLRTFTCHRNTS